MGDKRNKDAGQRQGALVITLPADCRIGDLPSLQAQLLAALQAPISSLDGGAVERIDTAALQLLLAFRRDAQANGATLHWLGASTVLHEAAERLGLAQTLELPAVMPA